MPERVITNAELARGLETSDEQIARLTGIRERRAAAPGECTSDLAAAAGRRALEAAGVRPEELDLLIVATVTGDMPTPATAAFVQVKLGASNAAAFDISAACAGSVYALSIADQFIRAGSARRVLVIGAEVLTRFLDWEDRSTCIIFGDGAGAVVLAAGDDGGAGLLSTHLHTDGSLADILTIPGPGSRHPPSEEGLRQKLHTVRMNGREVFRSAVRTLVSGAEEALGANGVSAEALKLVVTHQANIRIIEAVMERLGVPLERCSLNIDRFGNTSAASMLMSLDEAQRAGRLGGGDLVLLLAVGAGMSWGSALVRW